MPPSHTRPSASHAVTESSARSSSRPRRASRAIFRGRLYLVGIFLLLRAYEVWTVLGIPAYRRRDLLAYEAAPVILSTALLIAIGYRHNWARYLLIIMLGVRIAAAMIFFPALFQVNLTDHANLVFILSGPVLDCLVVWALIALPDIRRLTSRGQP